VSLGPPVTHSADPHRPMPVERGEQLDRVSSAIASLRDEQRRLERLGFETPLHRCHHQRRYWEFVGAVLSLDPGAGR